MIDRKMLKLSGATNCTAIAPSAPAMPVYIAETPKVSDLYIALFTPIASAAIVVVADRHQRAADAAAQQVPGEQEHHAASPPA